MSSLYKRINSIIPIVCAVSFVDRENTFYKLDAANKAIPLAAATDIPHGVVLDVANEGMEISAAPLGGNHGTVGLKLAAAVTDLRKDLVVTAASTAEPDDGAGARVIAARPLEVGSIGEIIEVVLIYPVSLAA